MIEETATIVAVHDDSIVVEAAIKTTCGGCKANTQCGTGLVARTLADKTQRLELPYDKPANVGQQVVIGIPEQHLLGASLWLYVMPLIALIAAASVGHFALPAIGLVHEAWNLVFTVAVTLAAFVLISGYIKRDSNDQYLPQVLRLVSVDTESVCTQRITLE